MATYYVDPVNGNDTNNGLGPDASNATNKPFKTWAKLLAASGVMVSGDTAYLAPGYYREVNTLGITNPVSQTNIIGDPTNAQGFKTASGVLVAPGPVVWTPYLTSDIGGASGTALITFAGRNFLSFNNIMFIAAQVTAGIAQATTTTSTNITFTDCAFIYGGATNNSLISMTNTFGTAFNWTFDRCYMVFGSTGAVTINCAEGTGSDYDVNVVVKNSIFVSCSGNVAAFNVQATGSGPNLGNGVHISNCTFFGRALVTTAATNSTTFPSTCVNSWHMAGTNVALTAGTAGQITENYNVFLQSGVNTNVTDGANSVRGNHYAPLIHFGQERIWGGRNRPFGEPMVGSPMLGFGNDGTQTSYDIRNNPRPAGGGGLPAVGAYERANTFTQETGTVHTGSNAISASGTAYQDFLVPVDSISNTFSIYARYDSNYVGSTKPELILLSNPNIGVSTATAAFGTGSSSADPGANAWGQLVLSSFTPTAQGIVTVRCLASDTSGNGKTIFDTFGVS